MILKFDPGEKKLEAANIIHDYLGIPLENAQEAAKNGEVEIKESSEAEELIVKDEIMFLMEHCGVKILEN